MNTRTLLVAGLVVTVAHITVKLTYTHLTGNSVSFITTATGFTLGLLIAAAIAKNTNHHRHSDDT